MNKEDTKQAILGFTDFFKGITGNQDLKIPDDIVKEYEIEPTRCKNTGCGRMTFDRAKNILEKQLSELLNNPLVTLDEDYVKAERMAIEALSSSEKPNKWIPVETALPEVGSQVLVCYEFEKKRYMYIADFYGDGKFHGLDYDWVDDVIAWMPLPTPYQSEIPTGSESEG